MNQPTNPLASRPNAPKEEDLPPDNNLGYAVTAIIFFIFGFVVAGMIGFSLWDDPNLTADPSVVEVAVQETFIALTPSPTPIPTDAPPQLTFSERDHFLGGNPEAKVIFVEFSDYRCPWCGVFAQDTLEPLMAKYDEHVAFIYRDFPIFGEDSVRLAHAAQCADQQDQFTDYHFLLFASQRQDPPMPAADENLVALANELDLDEAKFMECLARQSITQDIAQNFLAGRDLLGQTGTPTFMINGRRFSGAASFEFFSRIIDEELEKAGIQPPA